MAKFDVDSDVALLSLESKDYDTAPDGAYEAWMILEPTDECAADGVPDPGETRVTDAIDSYVTVVCCTSLCNDRSPPFRTAGAGTVFWNILNAPQNR